jgi:hypothetical protein
LFESHREQAPSHSYICLPVNRIDSGSPLTVTHQLGNGIGECLRRFLWQVMPDPEDLPMHTRATEPPCG